MRSKKNTRLALAGFAAGLIATLLFLRQPTQPLTKESLESARRQWQQCAITSYEAKYKLNGSLCEVRCRNGAVESLLVDGRVPNTADPASYSVDGLFDLLEMEFANLSDPAGPFGPNASNIFARVRFNNQVGYPERYIRGAGAGGRGASVEWLAFARID